jgi:hypothetical protein
LFLLNLENLAINIWDRLLGYILIFLIKLNIYSTLWAENKCCISADFVDQWFMSRVWLSTLCELEHRVKLVSLRCLFVSTVVVYLSANNIWFWILWLIILPEFAIYHYNYTLSFLTNMLKSNETRIQTRILDTTWILTRRYW